MKKLRPSLALLSAFGLSLAAFSAIAQTDGALQTRVSETVQTNQIGVKPPSTQADNTKRNKKVTDNAEVTAQDQSNSQADINLVAKVRRAIIDDNSLSVTAHNVKIIASNGKVILKGPIKNDRERARLSQIANKIVGADNVKIELEVSH